MVYVTFPVGPMMGASDSGEGRRGAGWGQPVTISSLFLHLPGNFIKIFLLHHGSHPLAFPTCDRDAEAFATNRMAENGSEP